MTRLANHSLLLLTGALLAISLIPWDARADGWASVRVYDGDYEADSDSDIYLMTGLSETLLLPYDIPVSVDEVSNVGDALLVHVGDTDGDSYPNYAVEHPIPLGDPAVMAVDWRQGLFLPILGDTNGDGRDDLLLQPRFAADHLPAMLSLAPLPGGHPRIDQYITPELLGLPVAADQVQLRLEDVNGDGKADLLIFPALSAGQVRLGDGSGEIDLSPGVPGSVEVPAQDPGESEPVGTLPGTVEVSAGGGLQYQLPLDLPPGIAGHAPSLAITYSSNGVNGHLGVGFALAGPSAVHRCPRLNEPDTVSGTILGVILTSQDELCLNGQRLVLVGGTHMAAGAVYRTEIDGFTRVTASGPSARDLVFTAELKDGRILTLGGSADAQVEAVGDGADYQWLVSVSQDRFGNEIYYHYIEDTTTGEHRLSSIEYDAALVELIYDTERADAVTRYLAGSPRRIDHRLREIKVSLLDLPLRDYVLTYGAPSPATGRERLASMTLCGYDEAGATRTCLPPTEIQWNEPLTGFDIDARSIPNKSPRLYVAQPMDWDGDGIGDLLTGDLAQLRIHMGGREAPGETLSLFSSANPEHIVMAATAFDAEGDGRDDVIYREEMAAEIEPGINVCNGQDDDNDGYVDEGCAGNGSRNFIWKLKRSTGELFEIPGARWTGLPFYPDLYGAAQATAIHIDGDGRTDLLIPIREVVDQTLVERWHVYRNESLPGFVSFTHRFALEGLDTIAQRMAVPMDLDGDGRQELIVSVDDELHALSFPDGFASPRGASHLMNLRIPAQRAVFLDANGDGLQDIAAPTAEDRLTLYLNRGAGFETIATGIDTSDIFVDYLDRTSAEDYVVKPFDYDGDGLSDLIFPGDGDDATYQVLLSRGDGFDLVDSGVPVYVVIVAGIEAVEGEPPSECTEEQLEEIAYWENQEAMTLELLEEVTELCEQGNTFYCVYRDIIVPLYLDAIEAEIANIYAECVGGEGVDPVPRLLSSGSRDFHFYDVNGDGQGDIVQVDGSSEGTTWLISLQTRREPDLVRSITDGLGATTSATYAPLTDPAVHTRGSGATFPIQEYAAPAFVVSALARDNGIGGQNRARFTYRGGRRHVKGRGFLGFVEGRRIEEASGLTSITRAHQAFPLIGAPYAVQQLVTETGALVMDRQMGWTTRALNGGLTRFPFAATQWETSYELDGGTRAVSLTENLYSDSYGNLSERVTTTGSGYAGGEILDIQRVVTQRYTYENDPTSWLLGFQTRAHTTYGDPLQGENVDVLDEATRLPGTLVPSEIVRYAGSDVEVIQRFDYDERGRQNVTTLSAESAGIEADRVSSLEDFDAGRYPRQSINALGHRETRTYDLRSGQPSAITDSNGLSAYVTYDPFSRVRTASAPDGSRAYTTYRSCDESCPALAAFRVLSARDGLPSMTTYHDGLGREIRSETAGFDGRTLRVDLRHDELGRVNARSLPYYAGDTPQWVTLSFDLLGRPLQELRPDGGATLTSYASGGAGGRQVVTRNITVRAPDGTSTHQITQLTYDPLGQLLEVIDPLGTPLRYRYDGRGQTLWIQVNADVDTTVELAYDVAGNKVWMSDPDAGEISYRYNGVGELLEQLDAKGQLTRLRYDALGRLVERVDDEAGPLEERHSWTWDDGPLSIGRLIVASAPGFTERRDYDAIGRLSALTTEIDGRGAPLRRSFLFDSLGRPSVMTSPSGLSIATVYNAQGYAAAAVDGATGEPLWTVEELSAFGRETSTLLGNGLETHQVEDPQSGRLLQVHTSAAGGSASPVQDLAFVFDTAGSLYSRADEAQGLREEFTHDVLNRLRSAVTTGLASGTRRLSYTYDALGNILTKTSVAGSYFYGQGGAGPHAVTSAGGNTYRYDPNGNMVEGAGRTLEWSAFNMPTRITRGEVISAFRYGHDRLRYQQDLTTAEGTTRTYYVDGGTYEEVHAPDGTVEQRTYVGGRLIHTQMLDAAGRVQGATRAWLHRDHLGSVDAITDSSGAVIERQAYGPFGERRTGNWEDGGEVGEVTSRGFTDHEHLDGVGLIHMNGRVYDPVVGRFTSGDLVVQFPAFTQSYSRYSYGMNRPTTVLDPSGYEIRFSTKQDLQSVSNGDDRNQFEPHLMRIAQEAAIKAAVYSAISAGHGHSLEPIQSKQVGSQISSLNSFDLNDWYTSVVLEAEALKPLFQAMQSGAISGHEGLAALVNSIESAELLVTFGGSASVPGTLGKHGADIKSELSFGVIGTNIISKYEVSIGNENLYDMLGIRALQVGGSVVMPIGASGMGEPRFQPIANLGVITGGSYYELPFQFVPGDGSLTVVLIDIPLYGKAVTFSGAVTFNMDHLYNSIGSQDAHR